MTRLKLILAVVSPKKEQTALNVHVPMQVMSEKEARQSPGMRERAALLFSLRHWRPYLIGREFVLRTDHKPNVAIADSKTKTYDTLSDEIMQFQPFRMEYLRGDQMFADALSRPPQPICNISNKSDHPFTCLLYTSPSPRD